MDEASRDIVGDIDGDIGAIGVRYGYECVVPA